MSDQSRAAVRDCSPLFDETSDRRVAICSCGRFVKDVRAIIRHEAIDGVTGECARHGRVPAYINGGWCWEDFFE